MQRHTLLQMSRELAEEYGYSGNDLESRLEHLRQLMRKMSKTKINTYFTDVSDHSHLNALYSFCCRNLAIDRYFADVDNKLATLKETLEQLHDEKIVELEQRQKQEQEEQTKIQEARLKLEKENDRRQQNITKWIGVVAVILTLFSALSDSYDLFGEDKLNWIPESLSSVCHLMLLFTAFFIVGAIAWKIIEDIQKENRSQDND
jgi:cation transport ATPase